MALHQYEERKAPAWPEAPADRPLAPLKEVRTEGLEDIEAPEEAKKERPRRAESLAGLERRLKRRLHDIEQELACLGAIDGEPSQRTLEKALKDRKIFPTSARSITSFNADFLKKRKDLVNGDPGLLGFAVVFDLLLGGLAGVGLFGLSAFGIGIPLGAALSIGIAGTVVGASLMDKSFENAGPRLRDYFLFAAAPIRYALSPLADFLSKKGIFRAARFVRSLKEAELDTDENRNILLNRFDQLEALAGGIKEELSEVQARNQKQKEERKTAAIQKDRTRIVEARRKDLARAFLDRTNEIIEEFDRMEADPEEASEFTEMLEMKKTEYLAGAKVHLPGSTGMSKMLNACLDSGPVLTREHREEVFARIEASLERRWRLGLNGK